MILKQIIELDFTRISVKENLRQTFQGSNNNPAFANGIKARMIFSSAL